MDAELDIHPPINWFGGFLIARSILEYTKSGQEDVIETLASKMNRFNFIMRVQIIMSVLNQYGPTVEAAQLIQNGGQGFFTDTTSEVLAAQLNESVEMLRNTDKPTSVFKFNSAEFGTLDFSEVPGDCGNCGECEGECGD